MKTSELIEKLNKISKEVPLNAEIVTGDERSWQGVDRVYHNPPHTYIQFHSSEENEWGGDVENRHQASITKLSTLAHMIEQVIQMIEANPDHSKERIINELGDVAVKMHSMADDFKKSS